MVASVQVSFGARGVQEAKRPGILRTLLDETSLAGSCNYCNYCRFLSKESKGSPQGGSALDYRCKTPPPSQPGAVQEIPRRFVCPSKYAKASIVFGNPDKTIYFDLGSEIVDNYMFLFTKRPCLF